GGGESSENGGGGSENGGGRGGGNGGGRIGAGWRVFPGTPVNRGAVRQGDFDAGRAYDSGGVVHPACFGRMLAPRGHADFVMLKPGADCPICLVRRPGCPLCWSFPEGFRPSDFAYEGGMGRKAQAAAAAPAVTGNGGKVTAAACLAAGGGGSGVGGGSGDGATGASALSGESGGAGVDGQAAARPELHTDLTTPAALRLYRQVAQCFVTVFVKTVPCGGVARVTLATTAPVSLLYDMFLAASPEGCKGSGGAYLSLPTVAGMYSLDNEDSAETDKMLGVSDRGMGEA
ncbi:unnamed protein product, partial [Phaeothamnion confervicola]